MVTVAKAIIHEYAVMVELLDASVAKVAVVRILRSQVLTVDAHVVKVVLGIDQLLQKLREIFGLLNVAWIQEYRQKVENNGSGEENASENVPSEQPLLRRVLVI